jgi:hypothetical protein
MNYKEAPKYKGELVVYTNARGEEFIYRLLERMKTSSGRIYALLQDNMVKHSFVRVDFDRIRPYEGK